MTFFGLSPLFAAGLVAAAAAVLFVLHHLRVRPEVRQVPTLLFWKEAVEETRARSLFGQFRHPRTYAFLSVLAALLVLALAEPETRGGLADVRHIALLVDVSPAMGARLHEGISDAGEAPGGRVLDLARTSARAFLDRVSLRDRVAVFTTGNGSGLLAGFSEARPLTLQRVEALEPGKVTPDLAHTLQRAASLLRGKSRPMVVLLTGPSLPSGLPVRDGKLLPSNIPIHVVHHGWGVPDQGLGGVGYGDTLEVRVLRNRSTSGRALVVRSFEVSTSGTEIARVDIDAGVDAGEEWVRIPEVPPTGDTVQVYLEHQDQFPHNDHLLYRLPLKQVRGVFADPVLGPAASLLIDAHPYLEKATSPSAADLVVVAGKEQEKPLRPGVRPESVWFGGIQDGAGGKRLPGLTPAMKPLRPGSEGDPVLVAAGQPLARVLPTTPFCLEMAPGLLDPGGSFSRSAAGVACLAGLWEWLAGNRAGAVTAPEGETVALFLPESVRRLGGSMVGEASLVHLAGLVPGVHEGRDYVLAVHPRAVLPADGDAGSGEMPAIPTAPFRLWEWLVVLALGLALLDGWLHLKGRIP